MSPYAEPLDGSFATEVGRVAVDRGTTVVAGMFEQSDDPGRPYSTLVVRGGAEAAYRKVHLYDSFGPASPTGSRPGRSSRPWSRSVIGRSG